MRPTFAGAVGIAGALAVVLGSIAEEPRASAPLVPCRVAVLVDGRLLCDAEVPADLGQLCGRAPTPGEPVLLGGDRIDRARVCAAADPGPGRGGWSRMAPADLAALEQPVFLDTASVEELDSLPRIGPAIAARIVAGRPYGAVEDLLSVKGIGPATFARLAPRVRLARAGGRP